MSKPVWIAEAERLMRHYKGEDPDYERKITEAMAEVRAREMMHSQKAREWEEGRKREIMEYKAQWVKNGRSKEELDDIINSS